MQQTKEEFKKAYSSLNKLIVKKDQFKNLHHLIPNKFNLGSHDPIYLKMNVNGKVAPLHIVI